MNGRCGYGTVASHATALHGEDPRPSTRHNTVIWTPRDLQHCNGGDDKQAQAAGSHPAWTADALLDKEY
jgi:hypothetical protein